MIKLYEYIPEYEKIILHQWPSRYSFMYMLYSATAKNQKAFEECSEYPFKYDTNILNLHQQNKSPEESLKIETKYPEISGYRLRPKIILKEVLEMNQKKAMHKFLRIKYILDNASEDKTHTPDWRFFNGEVSKYLTDVTNMDSVKEMAVSLCDSSHNMWSKNHDDMFLMDRWGIWNCIQGLFTSNYWLRYREQEYAGKEREYYASKMVDFTL